MDVFHSEARRFAMQYTEDSRAHLAEPASAIRARPIAGWLSLEPSLLTIGTCETLIEDRCLAV
jgi:hypothetical protein